LFLFKRSFSLSAVLSISSGIELKEKVLITKRKANNISSAWEKMRDKKKYLLKDKMN
jgi:hypothetical protein